MIGALLKKIMFSRGEDVIPLVRYLPSSGRRGRVFVAGDLHGEYQTLMKALRALGFDETRDRLIMVGDLHDRGEHSGPCLDLLRQPWIEAALGNHELMLLESVDGGGSLRKGRPFDVWMANGGEWILDVPRRIRAEWRRLVLENAALNLVVERLDGRRVLICHAEPDPAWHAELVALSGESLPLGQLRGSVCIWGRRILGVVTDDELTRQRKRDLLPPLADFMFSAHGHSRLPVAGWVNNQLFMDTGAVFGNRLTLVDLDQALPGHSSGVYSWEVAAERLLSHSAVRLFP